ncbi:adenosylcobinamide-phosphate synthase CbiB [Shewanella sp. KT0246]|uniref:adenosylcobinamide-phosphate synthase CbiB n=1 Tax=Shewanella sp. KT0246 TaxID=2815912 RepID=UPI001BBCEB22|nr:adenosylcobinamide-phosphate synthase CbiB [Shewanella sp. KT0246]GIU48420.1 cobalamin biosynthesis protein CobD [Shewanella sp. KT0246]
MYLEFFYIAGVISVALIADKAFGEVNRFHPLVGLGKYVNWVKKTCWKASKVRGLLALIVAFLPLIPLLLIPRYFLLDAIILYFVIGARSLSEHGNAVGDALIETDLPLARERVSMIVSRKTANLTEQEVVNATLESVLENGNDALFGALFWFAVAGIPGAIIYRFANTLDAMWGYKNNTFKEFGWAAAKFDDLLNYIPARICAIFYAMGGQFSLAIQSWKKQAHKCASPNGGVVMSAGAGSLNIQMGGAAEYEGYKCDKPILGTGKPATAQDIHRACRLVWLSGIYWVLFLLLIGLMMGTLEHLK